MNEYVYKVTYGIDSNDNAPTVEYFETQDRAYEWIVGEAYRRVAFRVEHSPYPISEQKQDQIFNQEMGLAKITQLPYDRELEPYFEEKNARGAA